LKTALGGVLDVPLSSIGQPEDTSLINTRKLQQQHGEVYQQPQNLPSVVVEMTAESEYNAADTAAAVSTSKAEFRAIFITAAMLNGYPGNLSDTSVSVKLYQDP